MSLSLSYPFSTTAAIFIDMVTNYLPVNIALLNSDLLKKYTYKIAILNVVRSDICGQITVDATSSSTALKSYLS